MKKYFINISPKTVGGTALLSGMAFFTFTNHNIILAQTIDEDYVMTSEKKIEPPTLSERSVVEEILEDTSGEPVSLENQEISSSDQNDETPNSSLIKEFKDEEIFDESREPETMNDNSQEIKPVDQAEVVIFENESLKMEVLNNFTKVENLFDESLVKKEEELSNFNPTKIDMENLKKISLSWKIDQPPKTLKGIEYAKNIEELKIDKNNLSNLESLRDLTNLKHLVIAPSFEKSSLESLSGIENLRNLSHLTIQNTSIRNVNELEGLSNLVHIDLSGNEITDISGLKNKSRLEELNLNGTRPDPDSEEDQLPGNHISDLTPLAENKALKTLHLEWTWDIEDLTPLEKLKNLEVLTFRKTKMSDVSPLSNLTKLKKLELYESNITDISSLAGLVNLEDFKINKNRIASIDIVKNMPKLETFFAYENEIEDVSPLEKLKNLKVITIDKNHISDLSPLKEFSMQDDVNINATSQNIKIIFTLTDSNDKVSVKFKNPIKRIDGSPVELSGDPVDIKNYSVDDYGFGFEYPLDFAIEYNDQSKKSKNNNLELTGLKDQSEFDYELKVPKDYESNTFIIPFIDALDSFAKQYRYSGILTLEWHNTLEDNKNLEDNNENNISDQSTSPDIDDRENETLIISDDTTEEKLVELTMVDHDSPVLNLEEIEVVSSSESEYEGNEVAQIKELNKEKNYSRYQGSNSNQSYLPQTGESQGSYLFSATAVFILSGLGLIISRRDRNCEDNL